MTGERRVTGGQATGTHRAGRSGALGIGELLWDLLPVGPRLGGAPFNVAAHLARMGHRVGFLTAVGDDDLGREAIARARGLGVATDLVQVVRDVPTGTAGVHLDDTGQPTFDIHAPAAHERIRIGAEVLAAIAAAAPAAIVFGTLAQQAPAVRTITREILAANADAMRVYDVNLREGCWTAALVDELLREASAIKLNDDEVTTLAGVLGIDLGGTAGAGVRGAPGAERARASVFAEAVAERYGVAVSCVTHGAAGATVRTPEGGASVPGIPVVVADTVGAGDAFTAGFVGRLLDGDSPATALRFANALAALVASREGAIPAWETSEVVGLATRGAG